MIDSLLNYKLQPLEKYQVVKMKQTINKGFSVSNFPRTRLRRNRMSDFSRKLVEENNLSINDLIYPIFVTYGSNTKEEIESMPGIYRFSLDLLPKEIENISVTVKKITNNDLFNKTLIDIKNFSPLFTKEAIQESLNNAKSLNGNECQIYLSALEDKFKNITKASEVIFKNDSSFIKRVEFQKEDLLNKFE